MAKPVYLDYSASAPVKPPVLQAVASAMQDAGNPSSIHAFGRARRHKIDEARMVLAASLGVKPENVIFTAGATEANNMALRAFSGHALLASAIEHASIIQAAPIGPRIYVDAHGLIDFNHLETLLKAQTQPALVSVMLVNNETGVIQPVGQVAQLAKKYGALVHCDAVQAMGRVPVTFGQLGVDLLSLSAHKIGGPQGVGALIVREGFPVAPFITGGGQEMRRRAGTENTAGICGFAAAINTLDEDLARMDEWTAWRDAFERHILQSAPDAMVFGQNAPRASNITCLAMPGVKNETQLMAFDLAGYAVSSGSACSSGKVQPSHVLKAMGMDDAIATSAIRISFGWASVSQDLTGFAENWLALYRKTREKHAA